MNDEELTEALRAELHRRAAALRPTPGRAPGPGDPPTTGVTRDRPAFGDQRYGDRPAVGDLTPAAGDLTPAVGAGPYRPASPTTGLRRSAPVLVAAAAAAVLVAGLVGVALSGGHHRAVSTKVATPATGSGPAPGVTTPSQPVTTLAPAPVSTVSPATTAPTTGTAAPAVPAGFSPRAVSFATPDLGWVLGQVPCGTGQCPAVARTTDGGTSWQPAGAPGVSFGTSPSTVPWPVGLRFADARNGWIYDSGHLWSTHDGGTTWQPQAIPGGAGSSMGDLVASAGTAYLTSVRPGAGVGIYTATAGSDGWTPAPVSPALGGGPVPTPLLVASGSSAWVLTDNRTVVSGARNPGGSGWRDWTPPCTKANGGAAMAAASPGDLVALCAEGTWGPPEAGTAAGQVWMYRSADGGSTFSAVTDIPGGSIGPLAVAPGQPSDILTISQSGILGSFDGGLTWATVHPGYGGNYAGFDRIAYTTATQAEAVFNTAQGTALVLTRDGGHTWSQVGF